MRKYSKYAKMVAEAVGSNGSRILNRPKFANIIKKTVIRRSPSGLLGEIEWLDETGAIVTDYIGPIDDTLPRIGIVEESIIGTDVTIARKKAGLSRAEMSRRFEIPVRTLEDWDSGKRTPPAWAEKLIIDKLESMESNPEE